MELKFEDLVGKTIIGIAKRNHYGLIGGMNTDEIIFNTSDGSQYKMYHNQDCCEEVYIEDIIGDLDDLLNFPIIRATEDSNCEENPKDIKDKEDQDSFTWTFYNIATIKGHVTIRWYGESNGYYSESMAFVKI